ncbi:REP element-mobilizing transposase RayT [Ekhidna lutea]|uniref:REP element-mobilizing transposase RayT n=1 Tax=Ekhidna lutea TaxID=447679 RepID=A0A239GK22_EKHLU|nr:transposase [Ekhidna lutea]SNS69490.1 REP element-mobilizing transposase RayT [Ekhidna lutea]
MSDSYQIKDQEGTYFLTCQVVGWVDVFSRQVYRDIIIDSLKYCIKEKELIVYAYVIMTNHVHLIVRSNSGRLSDTIRDFKRFTSNQIMKSIDENGAESRKDWMNIVFEYHAKFNKRVKDKQFWTHENHAVELSSNDMLDSKLHYIHENPVRAGWVENAEDYLYSSARNYAGLNNLLDIEMI